MGAIETGFFIGPLIAFRFAQFRGVDNVTVNCVHPGFTATDRMLSGVRRRAADSGTSEDDEVARMVSTIPLGKLVAPEDIADAVLFFCSPLASMITGQSIAVDGGWLAR